ncbi:MAG: alpha/beta hydrolase family protein [bacterium]
MKYTSRQADKAIAWQKEVRSKLFQTLKMDDLISRKKPIPFDAKVISSQKKPYLFQEIEINSTPGRLIKILLTMPTDRKGLLPAVVCIHGHGGSRHSVYDFESVHYVGFAAVLAEKGYITISTDVGQHEVYEEGRLLMGERLWDLMRCADYLASLDEVDQSRIGCAGLSLGGEMAMWLGAMDERIQATVSSGFLTKMDQMEQNHCMCWKFPGLRELVDFADIYSLTAPRALLCQNGLQEDPTQFPVPLAREALKEIEVIYADMNRPENVALVAHDGGHVIHLPSLLTFFEKHLGQTSGDR